MNPNLIALAAALVGLVTVIGGARLADATTARADHHGRPDPRFRINHAALPDPRGPATPQPRRTAADRPPAAGARR